MTAKTVTKYTSRKRYIRSFARRDPKRSEHTRPAPKQNFFGWQAKPKAKVAATKPTAKEESDEDSSEDEDSTEGEREKEVKEKKAPAKTAVPAKKGAKDVASKKKEEEESDEDSDDESEDEEVRLCSATKKNVPEVECVANIADVVLDLFFGDDND